MPYTHLTSYFLSGTGNSYRAAAWLGEAAQARGVEVALIPIERAKPREELRPGPEQLVGIYHPAHGLMPPWSMIKFLLRLPRGRGAHAAVVSTRGGIRIGGWVLPGAAGLGVLFPLLVLLLKGYRVRAGLSIDMPVNLINLHWGLSDANIAFIRSWGQRRHARLVEAVLDGRRYVSPWNVAWELPWCLIPFALWPLFPLAYLLIGRVFMAKLMFADTRCHGCGLCARACPNHAIVMVGTKPKVPFWTHHCEACLRCMGYCRFQAVSTSHLWIAPLLFLTSLLTASAVERAAASLLGVELAIPGLARSLVGIALTFPALILLYYAFWGMLRLRPLHVFFSYLTLTRYWKRRYHEPGTELKHLR
jgi:ferredoxin